MFNRTVVVYNMRRPVLQNRNVRQAIALMFDWNWTHRVIFQNAYQRTRSYFPGDPVASQQPPSAQEKEWLKPFAHQLPPELFTTPFQLPETRGDGHIQPQRQLALSLLQKAGWHLKENKLVHKDRSRPMQLQFIHYSGTLDRVILPFARNLKSIGIELEFKRLDLSQYYRRLQQHDFDLTQYVYPLLYLPGGELKDFYHSSKAGSQDSRSLMGLRDPVVDALVESISSAASPQELETLTRALDRVLLWQHYAIPNWHGQTHRLAWWRKLANTGHYPPYGLRLSTWWVEKPGSPGR